MFNHNLKLTALRRLALTSCLALLASCGSNGPAATAGASAPDNTSGGSANNTGTTPVGTTAAMPTNLSATPGNATVTVSWSAGAGATAYNVKRSTTSGGPYTQIATPTVTSFTDTSLNNGTTYYYVVSSTNSSGESSNTAQVSAVPAAPTTSTSPPITVAPTPDNCGMRMGDAQVVFCDTFDAPAGIGNGNRAGDLDGNVWGVSRAMGVSGVNMGQGQLNQWNEVAMQMCDGTTRTVVAPHDVVICSGQLREATNDNNTLTIDGGDVMVLAMYPKQPFDFAGRTGTVSFDVSNDTGGMHSAWPEFWMTDAPVPAPFNHFDSWQSLPANGFGVRFAAEAPIGMNGFCPNSNNIDKIRFTVDSAVVVRNYVLDDTNGYGTRTALTVVPLDCVIEASGPGQMNHIELRISQNQIDVYATDAGVAATTATLKHISVIKSTNLTLTRGLIWLEDVHYNADKGMDATRPTQRQHTFAWDNVAFDGPFTDRDFAYDAPDNTKPGPNGSISLGQLAQPNGTTTWNVAGLPANPQAAAVKVLFNFDGSGDANPTVINVTVNGHAHQVPWPYPDQLQNTWRTFAVTVALTDLVAGTNVVQLGADTAQIFSNVDLVLAGVPGGVPVLPGSNNAYPGH